MQRAWLALADGTIYEGEAFGATGSAGGEVVFNTSMTGYQEILTDPSYAGQMIVMTYPLIGNYGINEDDCEAGRPVVRGMIVKEWCRHPSNWRARGTIDEFLARHGIVGLAGIDTRALIKRLRDHGAMKGFITTEEMTATELRARAGEVPDLSGQDFISLVTVDVPYTVPGRGPRVALIDLGAKRNILRCLMNRGFEVTVVPAFATAAEIAAFDPAALVISNGPGDPMDAPGVVETIRAYLGRIPIFGVCLGHQLIALALGGRTYKLKFGHHGANHPVKDLRTGRVYITVQNHGFAVEAGSLPPEVEVSQVNVNDGTVEGLRHLCLPVWSVQYHPEASPGPADSMSHFDELAATLKAAG